MNSSEMVVVCRIGQLLQTEGEPLPTLLQLVLLTLEDAWPPVRASVTLTSGVALVTGRSEFPSGGRVVSFGIVRGTRLLGTLKLEFPESGVDRPEPSQELGETVALLLAQEAEIRRLGGVLAPAKGLVGSSGVMQEVVRLVDQAALLTVPVLLSGESGVGKALVAEAIHHRSGRSRGPLVIFNGTALPESMVETELFGHAKGLGGKFEEAKGGTLFLDEISDLSLVGQGRLLRNLEEGGNHGPRLIVSTRRNLEALAGAGRFRADLLARLQAFPIRVPPLRDRGSDIIALADHFVTKFSLQTGKEIKRISTPTLEMLLTYPWPGNVRELENVIERAVLLSDDEVIHGFHLPPSLQSSVHSGTRMHGRLTDRLDSLEYEMLVEALKASHGNITQAARELGLTKRIMGLRLKKFELDYRPFRQGPTDLVEDDEWN